MLGLAGMVLALNGCATFKNHAVPDTEARKLIRDYRIVGVSARIEDENVISDEAWRCLFVGTSRQLYSISPAGTEFHSGPMMNPGTYYYYSLAQSNGMLTTPLVALPPQENKITALYCFSLVNNVLVTGKPILTPLYLCLPSLAPMLDKLHRVEINCWQANDGTVNVMPVIMPSVQKICPDDKVQWIATPAMRNAHAFIKKTYGITKQPGLFERTETVLANMGEQDYLLDLSLKDLANNLARNIATGVLCGLTLSIIPAYAGQEITLTAQLRDRTGRVAWQTSRTDGYGALIGLAALPFLFNPEHQKRSACAIEIMDNMTRHALMDLPASLGKPEQHPKP